MDASPMAPGVPARHGWRHPKPAQAPPDGTARLNATLFHTRKSHIFGEGWQVGPLRLLNQLWRIIANDGLAAT